MANSLVKRAKANDKVVEYESNGELVKLSPAIIKNYLVNGNGNVSDSEVAMFLNLCRFQHLNPFLREAYLIKYGSQPATIVTSKDAFTKRARRQKDFRGFKAGVIISDEGMIEEREGTLKLADEQIVGGWAEVYVEGYTVPVKVTVSFDEYAGRTREGKLNSQWASKPGTMIRKTALVQALREAFPEEYNGLYSQEEMQIREELPTEPVTMAAQPIEEVKVYEAEPMPTEEETIESVEAEVVEADELDDIF